MNTLIRWHSEILTVVSTIATLVGGWLFGARYSEMSNRRRDYNSVALRVRNAISPALKNGYADRVESIDWDHLLHLLGRKRAAACQKARDDYEQTVRSQTARMLDGSAQLRDVAKVKAAAQRWFDRVPLR